MPSSSPRSALASALGISVLCAALIYRAATPPAVLPDSAPQNAFSAQRALHHVRTIAERPHPSGSADHARVREYIVAELSRLGLVAQLQKTTAVGTRYQVAGRVTNILARLPGKQPGGPSVLLAAHYDGVGAAPAAGDDASGSAALLETLRALKQGPQHEHDIIFLFTDAEESGLLGAAAFVREHPWAHDVAVMLNFEARGTAGRSLMFETGAGNLDVVRVLRTVPDVTASSLTVTVYRTLPNDTDLSELSLLGTPALNFAFIDGVERYHTAHDDVAHLDLRSLQHHGRQMLALAQSFADGPLPRPTTGDAIFFDFPLLGIIAYPEAWSLPVAIAVVLLLIVVVVRIRRSEARLAPGVAMGFGITLVAAALGGVFANAVAGSIIRAHSARGWDGAAMWSEVYAAALALLALALTAGCWAIARRWAGAVGLHAGAMLVWGALALVTAWKIPGASFLLVWPLAGMALATLVPHSARVAVLVAQWLGTIVAASLIVPVVYLTGGLSLPLNGPGAIAIGVLVPLLALLLAPLLETMTTGRRWTFAGVVLTASVATFAFGLATVRRGIDTPTAANLTYAMNADSGNAWVVTTASTSTPASWAKTALGAQGRTLVAGRDANATPPWLLRAMDNPTRLAGRPEQRVDVRGPQAVVTSDSATPAGRRIALRVTAAPGTLAVGIRVLGATVSHASVDGRDIATDRYRRTLPQWGFSFIAPTDSGFTLAFTVPRGAAPTLELTARSPGLPALTAVIAPRPADVVPIQTGDVTTVYRRMLLP